MGTASTLGAEIRRRRRELGLTQEELVEQVGDDRFRQGDLSKLERGTIKLPRRARLERIAAVLDLSLGELLARSGWNDADAYIEEVETEAPATDELRAEGHALLDAVPAHLLGFVVESIDRAIRSEMPHRARRREKTR